MIAVVEPDPVCPPALVGAALDDRGLAWSLVRSHAGESVPEGIDALIVLGGRQGAYEEDVDPTLGDIKSWIRRAVADGTPVLGICLGAQLIADAMGGRAFLAPAPEVGLLEMRLSGDDPLNPFLEGRWLFHHQDTFELPIGVEPAGRTAHPAFFRLGTATAVQFHPEVTEPLLSSWLAESPLLGPAGVDREDLLGGWAVADADLTARGLALVGAWIDQDVARSEARP